MQMRENGCYAVERTNGVMCLALRIGEDTVKATVISCRTYEALLAAERAFLHEVKASRKRVGDDGFGESDLIRLLGEPAKGLSLSTTVGNTVAQLAENDQLATATELTYVRSQSY